MVEENLSLSIVSPGHILPDLLSAGIGVEDLLELVQGSEVLPLLQQTYPLLLIDGNLVIIHLLLSGNGRILCCLGNDPSGNLFTRFVVRGRDGGLCPCGWTEAHPFDLWYF